MIKVDFYDLSAVADSKLEFAVIIAKFDDKFVFCQHHERDTWEIPGGHRNINESIEEAAKRELYEETGASSYTINPLFIYSVVKNNDITTKNYGQVFLSNISKLGILPNLEIKKIAFFDSLPQNLTYPQIQPLIINHFLLNYSNK